MGHSLADVARLASVSQATASRVISNSTYPVSREIRERVLAAAAELEYTPSALARALVTRHSRLLGVIVGDVVDPYFAEIARGVEDVAGAAGYLTFVCNTDADAAIELRYVQLLRDYRAEAMIFVGGGGESDPAGPALTAAVRQAIADGIGIVTVAPRAFPARSVTFDNREAMADATRHLIELGHRRIAYLDGPAGLSTSAERLAGFCDAIGAAGLDGTRRYPGRFDYESGRRTAGLLVREGLPDAVVASSDVAAVGLLTGFREAGVGVAEDVSVTGIDDIRLAEIMDLTTIRVPMHELGATAARVVLDAVPDALSNPIVLPHQLVVRGSTRARRPRVPGSVDAPPDVTGLELETRPTTEEIPA